MPTRPFLAGLAGLTLGAAVLVPVSGAQASADTSLSLTWKNSLSAATGSVDLYIAAGKDTPPFAEGEELIITRVDASTVRVTMFEGAARLLVNYAQSDVLVSCTPFSAAPQTELECTSQIPTRGVDVSLVRMTTPTTTAANGIPMSFSGGEGPDYVQGSEFADDIRGLGGDDALFGGDGDDDIHGDLGRDTIDGEAGQDGIFGGPGDDDLTGDGHIDVDRGQRGVFDNIEGGGGNDVIDALDGARDAVDCGNPPGAGRIYFDRGLDLPYNCPVLLAPESPRNVQAGVIDKRIAVTWELKVLGQLPPDFEVEVRDSSQDTLVASGSVSAGIDAWRSVAMRSGTYIVRVRAVNSQGRSSWSPSVGVKVDGRPKAPTAVRSYFADFTEGSILEWSADSTSPNVGIALRTGRPGGNWAAWVDLPISGKQRCPRLSCKLDLSADLKLVQGRLYQFRVRNIDEGTEEVSAWANSDVRFAGPLRVGSAKLTKTTAEIGLVGYAWEHNIGLLTDVLVTTTNGEAELRVSSTPERTTKPGHYRAKARVNGVTLAKNSCRVGVRYVRLDGRIFTQYADAACPKG